MTRHRHMRRFIACAAGFSAAAVTFAQTAPPPPTQIGSAVPTAGRSVVVAPTGLLAQNDEERLTAGFLETMDLVYAGQVPAATARVAELVELAPEDPRPYLLKARLMREYVSEQDNKRENVKPQVAPILEVLDVSLEKSEALLRKDPSSLAGHLYRGWTKMFRGQLHELAFEHWSAGRSAKAGKSDLDEVLRRDPNNPDAKMIMGTYLYFADLLPGVLKVASVVLRIPGGDRERGLELLESVEHVPSYSQHDARGMRGAILFGFEGKLEDARVLFDAFDDRFPDNPRLVEPLAVLDLWFADRLSAGLPRIQRVVQANATSSDPLARELAARLRLYEAYMEILTGHIAAGQAALEALHRENPGRPDWFEPIVTLYLADTYLLRGQREKALSLRDEAKAGKDEKLAKLLEFVAAESASASADEVDRLRRLEPVASAVYGGRLEEAATALDALGDDPLVSFYRGEIEHLRGRHGEALSHYERVLAANVPHRCRLFRRISRLRIAEIRASLGEWADAARTLDDEIERYDVKDMIRHVVRARQRHFEREAEAVSG